MNVNGLQGKAFQPAAQHQPPTYNGQPNETAQGFFQHYGNSPQAHGKNTFPSGSQSVDDQYDFDWDEFNNSQCATEGELPTPSKYPGHNPQGLDGHQSQDMSLGLDGLGGANGFSDTRLVGNAANQQFSTDGMSFEQAVQAKNRFEQQANNGMDQQTNFGLEQQVRNTIDPALLYSYEPQATNSSTQSQIQNEQNMAAVASSNDGNRPVSAEEAFAALSVANQGIPGYGEDPRYFDEVAEELANSLAPVPESHGDGSATEEAAGVTAGEAYEEVDLFGDDFIANRAWENDAAVDKSGKGKRKRDDAEDGEDELPEARKPRQA